MKRRLKTSYYQPKSGEWIQPVRKAYRMACCDCGLVHLIDFRVRNGRVQFAVKRGTRETAAIRRREHRFIDRTLADKMAAKCLKMVGRKSIRVGGYIIRLKRKKKVRA